MYTLTIYRAMHGVYIVSLAMYHMNIKVLSSLANSEKKSITIFIGLDMGSQQERLIPVIWDKENLSFIRDNNKEIQYKGSSCGIDGTKDNELVEKLAIKYLKSEDICVCSA